MKRVLTIVFALWQLLCLSLHAQNADAILGKWMDENQETIIEIYKPANQNFYNGRVVWVKDSLGSFGEGLRDVLNDNTELRSRKVLGTNMLEGFVWDDTDTWRKGEIYYYQTGNDYNGKIYLNEEGQLKLKGYYSVLFFLGRTKTWNRVSNLKPRIER
jgi:uncharacterized protein (DUF2147 family)